MNTVPTESEVTARAKAAARRIIDETPNATLVELVAIAWLDGRISVVKDVMPEKFRQEYDCFCQRCGKRDGTRMSRTPPKDGFFQTVCFACASGDQPSAWS